MKFSIPKILIALFFLICSVCYGQRNDSTAFRSKDEYTSNPFKRFGRDLLMQAVSPFHLSQQNAIWLGAGLLTTAGLIASDQGTYNTIKEMTEDTKFTNKVSHIITQLGGKYGLL